MGSMALLGGDGLTIVVYSNCASVEPEEASYRFQWGFRQLLYVPIYIT